jgi:WD40 repeat protein
MTCAARAANQLFSTSIWILKMLQEVLSLGWSAADFLASGSMDGDVRLWHPSRPGCLRVFQCGPGFLSVFVCSASSCTTSQRCSSALPAQHTQQPAQCSLQTCLQTTPGQKRMCHMVSYGARCMQVGRHHVQAHRLGDCGALPPD